MEVTVILPAPESTPDAEKAPTASVNTLMVRAAVFTTAPEAQQPTQEGRLQATSQSAAVSVEEAVEELKLFVPGMDLDKVFYRKGLGPMRLNQEPGKGEPPFLVMNDEATYFGDELLPFESTKFGSTLRASRMAEPDYIEAFLARPSLPPMPPLPTVENCEDGSLDKWTEPRVGDFKGIDELMSENYNRWKPLKDGDEAELDTDYANEVIHFDDQMLQLEPTTIDSY